MKEDDEGCDLLIGGIVLGRIYPERITVRLHSPSLRQEIILCTDKGLAHPTEDDNKQVSFYHVANLRHYSEKTTKKDGNKKEIHYFCKREDYESYDIH
jgi:hypothetical protein